MTFSLVACDLEARQWGVAVASKFPSVGAVVPWARGDVGAVATQAWANVSYGPDGARRCWPTAATRRQRWRPWSRPTRAATSASWGSSTRNGGAATYTGAECSDWAGGRTGPCFAAQGNILAGRAGGGRAGRLVHLQRGSLAQRLAAALLAADRAGGDRRGRQSARA